MSLSYVLLCYILKGHRPSETTKYKMSSLIKLVTFCFESGFSETQKNYFVTTYATQKSKQLH